MDENGYINRSGVKAVETHGCASLRGLRFIKNNNTDNQSALRVVDNKIQSPPK